MFVNQNLIHTPKFQNNKTSAIYSLNPLQCMINPVQVNLRLSVTYIQSIGELQGSLVDVLPLGLHEGCDTALQELEGQAVQLGKLVQELGIQTLVIVLHRL